jgi:hypothetical protein
MFDIITIVAKKIVESFSLSWIAKYVHDKKKNSIGTELFLLYSSLNEILVLGLSIIDEIDNVVSWMDRKVKENKAYEKCSTQLDFKLNQQSINLLRFMGSLSRLSTELQVISPNTFISVIPLVEGKFNAISYLIRLMGNVFDKPRLPYIEDADREEIERMVNAGGDVSLITIVKYGKDEAWKHPVESQIAEKLKFVAVEDLGYVEAKHVDVIKEYLVERNPRKGLAELEKVAKALRVAIAKNFSLDDILLSVGDRRCALEDPWPPFFSKHDVVG